MPRFLQGERVHLRALEKEDLEKCIEWVNDEETRFLTSVEEVPFNKEGEERWYEEVSRNRSSMLFAICTEEGIMGTLSLALHQRSAVLGIMIGDKRYWNRGYGSETVKLALGYCFDTLNLHRVELRAFEFNERAIRCYEKCGFRREGVMRDVAFKKGRYWNELQMAILEQEWRSDGGKV